MLKGLLTFQNFGNVRFISAVKGHRNTLLQTCKFQICQSVGMA
jgi:hypothetical protein